MWAPLANSDVGSRQVYIQLILMVRNANYACALRVLTSTHHGLAYSQQQQHHHSPAARCLLPPLLCCHLYQYTHTYTVSHRSTLKILSPAICRQVGTRLVACLTAIYLLLFIQEMAHPTKCPYFRAAPRELFHLRLGSARAFSPLRFRICFTMNSFWLEKSDFFIVVVC